MKVTLIDYTRGAVEKLIFTKSTRLNLSPGLMSEIRLWPEERKLEELRYIARTIRSSWEFVSYTFLIEGVSRAFTHQFVRTRQASYAQQSMRVTNMSQFDFVMPERLANAEPGTPLGHAKRLIEEHNAQTAELYSALLNVIPAEDARSILPTNVATNIVARFTLRAFSELAASRLGGRTQDEYRRVVEGMVDAVLGVHPWTKEFIFGDLSRDHFAELEAFAREEFPDLLRRGKLLKIVDQMRKRAT